MPYRLTNSGAIVDASGNVVYESCALEDLSPKAKRRIVQIENDAEHHGLEIEFEKDVLPVLIREGLDEITARPAPAGCAACGHPPDAHAAGYACTMRDPIAPGVAEWCQCDHYRPAPAVSEESEAK